MANDGKDLNLTNYIYEANNGDYVCLFCVFFKTRSRQTMTIHIERIHENETVRAGDHYFVGCCCGDSKQRGSSPIAHYHCLCNIVFLSRKAITGHVMSGACKVCQKEKSTFSNTEARVAKRPSQKIDFGSDKRRKLSAVGGHDHSSRKPGNAVDEEEAMMEEFECEFVARSGSSYEDESNSETSSNGLLLKRNWNEKCRLCEHEYRNIRELIDHTQTAHPHSKSVLPINLMCTICGKKLEMVDNLAAHYRDDHKVAECEIETISFRNAVEFYSWKCDLETKTFSNFIKRRRTIHDKKVALFFSCSCSWYDNRAASKAKRTERFCAAFIKATQAYNSNEVSVKFCHYHVGHDITSDQFWKSVRKSLHGFVTLGHKARTDSYRKSEYGNDRLPIDRSSDIFELDEQASFYWELMREKLEESGVYPSSIFDGWTSTDDSDDPLCQICHVEFKNRKSMMRHMVRTHGPKRAEAVQSKFCRPVRCLFCNMEMAPPGVKNLLRHYVNAHDQDIRVNAITFRSASDFDDWRDKIAGCAFRRYKMYRSANGEFRQYWTCKYSGKLTNPPVGVTEGHCPAWIFAQESFNDSNLNQVQVSYCLDHIGHEVSSDRNSLSFASSVKTPSLVAKSRAIAATTIPFLAISQPSSSFFNSFSNTNGASASTVQLDDVVSYQILDAVTMGVDVAIGANNQYIIHAPPVDNATIESAVLLASAALRSSSETAPTTTIIDSGIAADENGHVDGQSTSTVFTFGGSAQLQNSNASFFCFNPMATMDMTENGTIADDVQETPCRGQIDILIRSVSGRERFLKLPLDDYPLVMKEDGRKFYALEKAKLLDAVSQALSRQGECLYEGDQWAIVGPYPVTEVENLFFCGCVI